MVGHSAASHQGNKAQVPVFSHHVLLPIVQLLHLSRTQNSNISAVRFGFLSRKQSRRTNTNARHAPVARE